MRFFRDRMRVRRGLLSTSGPDPLSALPAIYETRREQIFPRLTMAQIARLVPHGKRIRVHAGQVLTEPGERNARFIVVLSGAIEVVRAAGHGEERVVLHEAGQLRRLGRGEHASRCRGAPAHAGARFGRGTRPRR